MSFTNARIVAIGADDEEYHAAQTAERGTPEFVMSCSALREFANCPSRWKAGYERDGSSAMEDGSLVDCCLLTPDKFAGRYAIRPATYDNDKGETKPWNANSNVCKAWLAEHEDVKVTTKDAFDEAQVAIARLRADELIGAWLDCCDTQVWLEAVWEDKPTGLKVKCKSLLDFVPNEKKATRMSFPSSLGDFKRTRNASAMAWMRWCYQSGYHIQGAFYTDVFNATLKEDERPRDTFCFILSENFKPYEPGKRILSQDFMDFGRASYRKMMGDYCACLKSGRWPGYDDNDESISGWGLVVPSPWMAMNEQCAPHYTFPGSEDPTEAIPFTSQEPS